MMLQLEGCTTQWLIELKLAERSLVNTEELRWLHWFFELFIVDVMLTCISERLVVVRIIFKVRLLIANDVRLMLLILSTICPLDVVVASVRSTGYLTLVRHLLVNVLTLKTLSHECLHHGISRSTTMER